MTLSAAATPTSPASRSAFWWGCLLLMALAVLVFYPTFFAQFNWDDDVIVGHAYMRDLAGLAKIWLNPSQSIGGDYWPLNYTSHWIEYQLWGMQPAGYHAVNLLLHILNACLLLYLLQRLALRGALLAAILFTIHPMQISSVAWVVERKDLLNSLFYLLTFLAWVRFEEDGSKRRYAVALLLFVASLLCKSMSITWPAAALVYCWWRTGRIERRRVGALLPFLLLGVLFAVVIPAALASQKALPVQYQPIALSVVQRILLIGRNLTFYAGKLVWPAEHVPSYPHWSLDPHRMELYLFPVAVLALILTLWFLRHRIGRGPLVAALFYSITLSPVLGLISWSLMNMTFVQDHYQYVACIGPFLLFATAFESYAPRLFRFAAHPRRVAYGALALVVLLPLAVLAQRYVRLYQDRETLFRENYARYPQANMVANHYAMGLFSRGQYIQAYLLMDRVTERQPLDAKNWRLKAKILWRLNRLPEACDAYEKTIALDKTDAETFYQYGSLLLQMNRPDKALGPLRQARDLAGAEIPAIREALQQAEKNAAKMP